jgi:hypothetical protein
VQWPRDYRTQPQIDRDIELVWQARVAANVTRRQARIKPDTSHIPAWMLVGSDIPLRGELPSILQRQAA